ncbi:MAG: AbrB/MazE/SpoVT family DNA-binding domain-containing protein [bacterium]|nr:AbrB/MazE/SpoVT family DNA-binding domain-containing protein [bacterium]
MKPATTRMSSKGQVVIPRAIRDRLGLRPGTQFVVVGDGDVVILKRLSPPTPDEYDDLVSEAEHQAERARPRGVGSRKAGPGER